ncbi:kinase-like domain-containing protein [Suillus fuscotomentosus]|uniref:Kinase-like domain-containing protein n=1 Tax=Suillus fuscotomentosus TaxID=1912939 RepID=A0AAD4EG34_9AGAM|nr:kinase-like domain-containing protein [Suillus fuscotomentosus]KAG1904354.1 kinase-like domain-containing protein [Suillus fuscotomentosus]
MAYKCEWTRPTGPMKVAVIVIKVHVLELYLQSFRQVAENCAVLMHDNIVPVFGMTEEFGSSPALVLPWFQTGTLLCLIAGQGAALNIRPRLNLLHGVISGLCYLHELGVVHGDITSSNILVDVKEGEYVARLTGFSLATIFSGRSRDHTIRSNDGTIRWTAPELLKRVMFHVLALVIPWNDINDIVVLQRILGGEDIPRPATPDMTTARWNEIAQCWSPDVSARPSATMVTSFLRSELENLTSNDISAGEMRESHSNAMFEAEQGNTSINTSINTSKSKAKQNGRGQRISADDLFTLSGSQRGLPPGRTVTTTAARSDTIYDDPGIQLVAENLTGQIFGGINDYVASGAFANIYRCEWRQPSGPVKKVAVKTFRYQMDPASEQDLRRFRRATGIWAHLVHNNIVAFYGTAEGFGPTTALVSQWFPDGTLSHLIREQGATLTIKSKLKLLHGIASGLYYIHSFSVVHGDITSSNVLVDLKEGEYKACLTDFGLSNVLHGRLKMYEIEGSTVRPGAIRWTAPELLGSRDSPSDIRPTTQNDMYSFGRVMFHLLTLIAPWHDIVEYKVLQKIQNGEDVPRPEVSEATSDVTDARWGHIEQCWSIDPPARPCALTAMNFITGELEALKQDVSS